MAHGAGRPQPTDFFGLQVQRGNVPGVTFNNKFGRNAATATGDAIWSASTAYVEPATAAGTPVIGTIALGYNQTQSTIYMVPRNYTAYINSPKVAGQNVTVNALCDIGCFKKEFGGVFRVQMDFNLTGGASAYQPKAFGAPLKFEPKSTILFKCISASGGGTWDVAIDYDIWLVAN